MIIIVSISNVAFVSPWRYHDMKTLSALLAIREGNPLVTGSFPSQKVSDAELCCFLYNQVEQAVEWVIELLMIWGVSTLMLHTSL